MAKTFTLSSHKYDGRYMKLTCTQTPDIGTNTSKINWTLTVTGGSVNYYTTGPTTVKINGVTVYYKDKTSYSTQNFPAAKGSVSGSLTVNHDSSGAAEVSVSIKTNIYTGVLKTSSERWTLDSIDRFAVITSASDFNDEENPTITYSNPAGNNVTSLRACISLDGTNADIAYRDIDKAGTSYTFNLTDSERDVLRTATVGSNSRNVKFHIYTLIGTNEKYESVVKTFTIKNPNPTINPTIKDVNDTTIALTGNSMRLIRYCSNAEITIGATAVKKSTITSKKIECGNSKLTADGIIKGVTTNEFVITVTDSRGNITSKTYKSSDASPIYSFVNYIKPTCVISNNMPDAYGNMKIVATGNYFNGSFGKEHNALNVYYRYKVHGDEWTEDDKWTLMSVTPNGNSYEAEATLSNLDPKTVYTFETYARDVLNETEPSSTAGKSTPVFDWGENDFKFNVSVYDEFDTVIRNGKAAYTGSADAAIDPDTTVEELCLTDHSNCPKPGYWFFIRTMLYGDVETTAYRSQIAVPSGATLSVYHRFFSEGTGWSPWRRHLNEDEKYIQMKTLWRNASTTSSFANQTLSLDLTNYDMVHVEFLTDCSTGAWKSYRITMTVPVNHETEWKNYKAVGFGSNGTNIAFRAFHMGENTIRFGEGYYASSYATSSLTTNNNLYIPLRIYGIKGVT